MFFFTDVELQRNFRMLKCSFHKLCAILENVMKTVAMHVAVKLGSFAEHAHIFPFSGFSE